MRPGVSVRGGEVVYWGAAVGLAVLALTTPSLKWQSFLLGAAALVTVGIATRNDPRVWLFMLGALTAYNFNAFVGGDREFRYAVPDQLSIYAIDIPLAMLALSALTRGRRRGLSRRGRYGAALAGAFCLWGLLGLLTSAIPALVAVETVRYLRLAAVFVVVAVHSRDPRRAAALLGGLFVGAATQSALAVVQFLTGNSFGLYRHFYEETEAGGVWRAGGTLNPTVLSEYLAVIAPVALAAAFVARRRGAAFAAGALYALVATATVLTFSRAGIINLALSTLFVVAGLTLRRGVSSTRRVVVAGMTLIVAAAVSTGFAGMFLARVGTTSAEFTADAGRVGQMRIALAIIADHPVLGVGLGNYMEAAEGYGLRLSYPVHNKLLHVASETGVPGGVLYVLFWVYAILLARRAARAAQPADRGWLVAIAAGIVGSLLNMNTDVYALGGAPELSLFIVAGLANGIARRSGGA